MNKNCEIDNYKNIYLKQWETQRFKFRIEIDQSDFNDEFGVGFYFTFKRGASISIMLPPFWLGIIRVVK